MSPGSTVQPSMSIGAVSSRCAWLPQALLAHTKQRHAGPGVARQLGGARGHLDDVLVPLEHREPPGERAEQRIAGGRGQERHLGPAGVHGAGVGHAAAGGHGQELRAQAHAQHRARPDPAPTPAARTSAARNGSSCTRVALWRPPSVTMPAISAAAGSGSGSPGLRSITSQPPARSDSRTIPTWRSGRWVMMSAGFTTAQDRSGATWHAVAMVRLLMAVLGDRRGGGGVPRAGGGGGHRAQAADRLGPDPVRRHAQGPDDGLRPASLRELHEADVAARSIPT